MSFTGKIVVVTGAAMGIGAATAMAFAEEGAHVVVTDYNAEVGMNTAAAINAAETPGTASFQFLDVSDWSSVQAGTDEISTRFGRIDTLVNNAGMGSPNKTPDLEVRDWHRTIAVTLDSVFYCCKAVIPLMKAAGGGTIVNVGSTAGLGGDYGLPAYSAAKGGVINYTRALAIDHIREGIRINCVCAGLVETPASSFLKSTPDFWANLVNASPRGKAAIPEEIASIIVFLASKKSTAIVGAALVADGGLMAWTGLPNLLNFNPPEND